MGESGVERVGEGLGGRGSFVWGEAIGADLRCGVGEFRAGEAVALWSVSGTERAARGGSGEASVWGDSGGSSGVFRDSTIDAQEQAAGRALRVIRGSVPAGGRVWNLAR